jgi:hypothetical protein
MSRRRIGAGAIVAGAAVIALVLWIVLSGGHDSARQSGAPQPAAAAAGPRLDQNGLVTLVRTRNAHAYWVGPRVGSAYEFTTTPAGRAFVRYLPNGVNPGDPRPDFLTVATYPVGTSALTVLRLAGKERGAQTVKLPDGALIVTETAHPMSVYFARRGWRSEVEVYHPRPGEALRLAIAGAVREIR